MQKWLNSLNSTELTWLMVSALLVLISFGMWIILGKLKIRKNFQIGLAIGFFVLLFLPLYWLIDLADNKRKFEEGQLLEVLEIDKNGQKYLVTFSLSVTTGKSSTTHWLAFDVLEISTGRRIRRGVFRLGSVWDLKILGYSEPYIAVDHYGIKLFNPFAENVQFESEENIKLQFVSKFPHLSNKVAKFELRQENVGLIARFTLKNGEQSCIWIKKWQSIDCQKVNLPAYLIDSENEKPKIFTYFNFIAYYWRDSTWITMGLPDKNNPYKSRFYRHLGTPNYNDGISVTFSEGDSTRSLLPKKEKQGLSFPQRLEVLGNQDFIDAQFLFISDDLAILRNKLEVGGSNRLTAFNLAQQKIHWQLETDSFKLHPQVGAFFQTRAINGGKNLILFASKIYPIRGGYRIIGLETQSGRKVWEYDFK